MAVAGWQEGVPVAPRLDGPAVRNLRSGNRNAVDGASCCSMATVNRVTTSGQERDTRLDDIDIFVYNIALVTVTYRTLDEM